MWKLIEIKAKNLCAFNELDYTLLQNHTTLIFGNNMDNDSQGSNGSGKSAMLEAIAIALTGEPLRKIKMEEIINDSEEEAMVEATLFNESDECYMRISRIISRKAAQSVKISQFYGEKEEETVEQAGVSDYNKYILETLGLTKDDIYANFILSKNKYTSFLSCSDREKKEIINRFSNGNLVDESIAALQADIEPIEEELSKATTEVAVVNGRIDTLRQQIDMALQESTERSNKKAERIAGWKQAIVDKRAYIREQNNQMDSANELLDKYDDCDKWLQDLEGSSKELSVCYTEIKERFLSLSMSLPQDYTAQTAHNKAGIAECQNDLMSLTKQLAKCRKSMDAAKESYSKLQVRFDKFHEEYDAKYDKIKQRIEELAKTIRGIESENDKLTSQHSSLIRDIANLEKQLAGVIVCPNCKHEFTLADDINIQDVRLQLQDRQGEVQDIENTIDKNHKSIEQYIEKGKEARSKQNELIASKSDWSEKLTEAQTAVDSAVREHSTFNNQIQELNGRIAQMERTIENSRTCLFDEAYDILDVAYKNQESIVDAVKRNVGNAEGAIQSYEESIKDIERASETDVIANLKSSQAKYEKELSEAISHQETVQQKLNEYKVQESTFVEFKTHLANTKIEALSHITNEFLEGIGSDIRISFSGYTVLKSGKIRDKISISLLRDGIDCGSFDKFSAGERARVELATILAMNKLTNTSCDDGKGLDLLVLDEILEAVDEQGLNNIFNALNQLKITSLVVSHGNIAEGYPYRTVVNKLNGVSFIDGK